MTKLTIIGLLAFAVFTLLLCSGVPVLLNGILFAGQLTLFAIAGARLSDLYAGKAMRSLDFIGAVGSLLILTSICLWWFPTLGYSHLQVDMLRIVGVVLLLLNLILPQRYALPR